MPQVPNVPGVPALTSYSSDLDNPVLLLADAITAIIDFFLAPQWGIYLFGIPVLSYDNQVAFDYRQDWAISTYPVEQGAFQSYDKVQLPSEIRCRFSAGGDVTNREEMLSSIDAVMSDTNLYDVVTPEIVFLNYNFMHRSYDRTAANVGLVVVDVWLMEIMQSATAQFQNTLNAFSQGQAAGGPVGTQTPSAADQSAINSGMSSGAN